MNTTEAHKRAALAVRRQLGDLLHRSEYDPFVNNATAALFATMRQEGWRPPADLAEQTINITIDHADLEGIITKAAREALAEVKAERGIAAAPTLSPESRVTIRNALDWSRTTAPGDGLAIAKYVAEAIAELDALP